MPAVSYGQSLSLSLLALRVLGKVCAIIESLTHNAATEMPSCSWVPPGQELSFKQEMRETSPGNAWSPCFICMIANQKTQPLYRQFWHDTSESKPSGYGAQSSLRSHVHGRTTIIAGHHGGKTSIAGPDINGHPFERLSTRGDTPEDDVPLQGIHIRHEVTIQRSTMTWYDEGKM